MINQYSVKYSSCILLKYLCFSPHYLRALIHLSHLGTILKILSDCKAGCCIRNHSRAATSTASHLWNQQRRKYCFMYPNFRVFIWSVSKLHIYQLCSWRLNFIPLDINVPKSYYVVHFYVPVTSAPLLSSGSKYTIMSKEPTILCSHCVPIVGRVAQSV